MAGRFNLKDDAPTPSEGATLALSFEPLKEVAPELAHMSHAPSGESFARVDYHPECEVGVNEQINVELTISYVYLALHSFASCDDVGLPGLAAYFEEQSNGEREHAKKLLKYQNKRGGRVKLHTLVAPETEFTGPADKGDALYMMELALSLEKLNFRKLRALHDVAVQHNDPEMADFLEEHLLLEQTRDIRQVAVYVSQLRRAGQGLGFFEVRGPCQRTHLLRPAEVGMQQKLVLQMCLGVSNVDWSVVFRSVHWVTQSPAVAARFPDAAGCDLVSFAVCHVLRLC